MGEIPTVAVYDVPRSVEYGLEFYRNQKISSYERNEIPEGDHLVVAAAGSKAELEYRLKGRRVTRVGGLRRSIWTSMWCRAASSSSRGRSVQRCSSV